MTDSLASGAQNVIHLADGVAIMRLCLGVVWRQTRCQARRGPQAQATRDRPWALERQVRTLEPQIHEEVWAWDPEEQQREDDIRREVWHHLGLLEKDRDR
jgi:hypothetical protein